MGGRIVLDVSVCVVELSFDVVANALLGEPIFCDVEDFWEWEFGHTPCVLLEVRAVLFEPTTDLRA